MTEKISFNTGVVFTNLTTENILKILTQSLSSEKCTCFALWHLVGLIVMTNIIS